MKLTLLAFALALLAVTATPSRSANTADVPAKIIDLTAELGPPPCHKKYILVYEPSERAPVVRVYVIEDDYSKDDKCP